MVLLWTTTTVAVAQKRENHEFVKNMPVYMEQLIADLDYPLAWGNSKIKNFKKWKKTAREKVFECMLTPPAPPAHFRLPPRFRLPAAIFPPYSLMEFSPVFAVFN